jgi:hypothetical protein
MPPIRTKKITDVLVAHKRTSDTLKSREHIEAETVIIGAEESVVASVEDGDEAEEGKNALVNNENIPKPKKVPTKRRSPKKKAESPLPEPILTYNSAITNSLYHNIIIKTLDHALHRNIDWYAMSKRLKRNCQAYDRKFATRRRKGRRKMKT